MIREKGAGGGGLREGDERTEGAGKGGRKSSRLGPPSAAVKAPNISI